MSRGVLGLVVRSEIRRSWRSMLGLALIVAVVGTVVLATAAGARRTASTLDRAEAATGARDLRIQVDEPDAEDQLARAVADRPEVAAAASVSIVPVDGGGEFDLVLIGDPDGVLSRDIDRPLRIRGRLPAADAPDEVTLNETAAHDLGLDLGDDLHLGTFSQEDLDALLQEGTFNGFNGTPLDLRVVGVMEALDGLQGGVVFAGPVAQVGPAFFTAHEEVAGFPPVFTVRFDDALDQDDQEALVDEISGDLPVSTEWAEEAYGGSVRRSIGALTVGLVVFTVVAGLAGLMTVGQAVSRQVRASGSEAEGLRRLGLERRSRAMATAVPVTLAIAAGAVVGAAGSVLASPLFPIGLARQVEPDPGIHVDPLVLLVGTVVLGLAASAVALWRSRDQSAAVEEKVPFSAALIQPLLPRVVPLIGVRMALEPGRGRGAVPVRSAVVGAALGALGIVAVGVVSVSLTHLVHEPSQWGWTWSSAPDAEDPDALAADLAEDDRLDAVGLLDKATVQLDGTDVAGFALEVPRGDMALALGDGRAPSAPGEVAIGERTADRLGVGIGDHVEAQTPHDGTVELEVVGEVVLPIIDNTSPGEGALLTPEGLEAARGSDGFKSLLVDYPDDADVGALEDALAEDYGLSFSAYSRPTLPGDVANVNGLRTLTLVLGGFFAALAVVALAHVLTISSRRRRGDFAVLRAFGFRRREVRRSVAVQAVVTVLVGTVVGVPLGLAVGRLVWRLMVGDLGVLDDPSAPWPLLIAVLPALVVAALVVAALPAWAAARRRPAELLRAE
jgi:hypothetical protein